jgi:hypothetical protein
MQTLIKERGKDQIANVAQRNSVYQTIAALKRAATGLGQDRTCFVRESMPRFR